jgi:hypothetical protein
MDSRNMFRKRITARPSEPPPKLPESDEELKVYKVYLVRALLSYKPTVTPEEIKELLSLLPGSVGPANAPAEWAGQKAALNAKVAAMRSTVPRLPFNRNLARASAAVLQRVGVPSSRSPNIVPNSIRRAAVNARSAKNAVKAAFTLSEAAPAPAPEPAPAPALPIKTLSEGKQAGTEVGDDQLGGNRRTKKNRKGKKSKSRQKSESKSRTKSRPRTRSRRH